MKYGFVKTATAVPGITVGDCHHNAQSIIALADEAAGYEAEILLLPELCLTSGTCGDLYTQPYFLQECEKAIALIAQETRKQNAIIVLGAPAAYRNAVYNCAIVLHKGKIACVVPKEIPGSREEGCENRWFASGAALPQGCRIQIAGQDAPIEPRAIVKTPSCTFGIAIGNDMQRPMPASAILAAGGAEIILNMQVRSEEAGRIGSIRAGISHQSERLRCGYMLACSGWGESTARAVHSGYAAIAECGEIIAQAERFQMKGHITVSEIDVEKIRNRRAASTSFTEHTGIPYIYIGQEESACETLTRKINSMPFLPEAEESNAFCNEVFMIQATALARRIEHTRSKCAVIGISGGLDSTHALLVAVKAFDLLGKPHSDIITVTMPGFGTSGRTYLNALNLMNSLGTTVKEISIKEACIQHFKDISHDISNHDITYENSQARERTQILMDIANQQNGIVIGTGDMSELALGWATYNGDHMSMYGVNATVPKTLMQHIARWMASESGSKEIASTLLDILDTPISPELTPADEKGNIQQKTEDLVGPYDLQDFFLHGFVHNGYSPAKICFLARNAFKETYSDDTIRKWLKTFMWRFFTQQFKRSCLPDGPRTGCCSIDTHGWNMPSDASPALLARMCSEIG